MKVAWAAFAFAVVLCSTAVAQRVTDYWIPSMVSQGDRLHSVLFVDASRIQIHDDLQRRAWYDLHFNPALVGRGATRLMMFMHVDCRERRVRSLQASTYFADGTHVNDGEDPDWTYPQPSSRGEAFTDFVCAPPADRSQFGTHITQQRDPAELAAVMFELPAP